MNLGGNQLDAGQENFNTQDPFSPQTSLVTVFVSGKNPGEFSKVISTITLSDLDDSEKRRYKRSDEELLKLMLAPTKVQPVARTAEPSEAFDIFNQDDFSAYDLL